MKLFNEATFINDAARECGSNPEAMNVEVTRKQCNRMHEKWMQFCRGWGRHEMDSNMGSEHGKT